jgi:hypothetical protein
VRISPEEIKKSLQNAGKGYNAILDVAIPVKHIMAATERFDGHVPENGGT